MRMRSADFSPAVFVRRQTAAPVLLALAFGMGGSVVLAGCGGGGGHGAQTTEVQGIVLSYPETLTGTVTEADLTPVGAGTTVGVFGWGGPQGLDGGKPPYYREHAFPQTDASGRFSVAYDESWNHPRESLYVADRCGATAMLAYRGDLTGYPGDFSDTPTHNPGDQLIAAEKLADGLKARYHVMAVIVVTRKTDACAAPQLPSGYPSGE